jgi:hypothetical protein
VQQCLAEPEKMQALIAKDLNETDGNAGAVCQALAEVSRILFVGQSGFSFRLTL